VDRAFRRYRFMSFVTGTTLLVLCVFLILHSVDRSLWTHLHLLVTVVGIGHGTVLYPIYLVLCFQFFVAARGRLHLGHLVAMLLAGFVPGLAFYMERRVERVLSEGAPSATDAR
jgi:integral membrane protein